MATRALAHKLGLVEVIRVEEPVSKFAKQEFDFLLVLDFEATCWEKKRLPPEIIEFPVVLYDVNKKESVDEFQQYVMPTENPKLSEFCKRFTGIQQSQVDNGVPLGTCVMVFMKWIGKLRRTYNLIFPNEDYKNLSHKVAFVTWSDWDLNICLNNECKRKRVVKPSIFLSWIDLKALYIEHYKRVPKGLNGALSELGMEFEGRQHCGLDDARNTAKLAERMINDGILPRITKDIRVKT